VSEPVERARELGADFLLTGTVRWDAAPGHSRVRITPRLVDVEKGTVVYSEVFDRSADDIFSLQTEIARRVAERLGARLTGGAPGTGPAVPTPSPEAYRLYLRAVEHDITFESEEEQLLAISLYSRRPSSTPRSPTPGGGWRWSRPASFTSATTVRRREARRRGLH